MKKISERIIYVGADDKKIDLFEGQYPVPNGVSYNSYVIRDEKIAVMDTVDAAALDPWFDNLEEALDSKAPDYLIVSHLEPDHSAGIEGFMKKYPETKLVANAKTWSMISQFIDLEIDQALRVTVAEGDSLSLGEHELKFIMAPMVHWPEVMLEYETKEKVLFSADTFGTFGILEDALTDAQLLAADSSYDWNEEARRYFVNIVGKYGNMVQTLLKKAAGLDIAKIAPLHGPVLTENLERYIGLYDSMSQYKAEKEGTLVAYVSLHGNTKKAALELCDMLKEAGKEAYPIDLARVDVSYALAKAFEYNSMVLASVTWDGMLPAAMEDFLYHLKAKTFRNRKVALIENGTWGPLAAKLMTDELSALKDMEIYDNKITIKTRMNALTKEQLKEVCNWL